MNHYVYEITNLINGKKYIGKRSCKCNIENDGYMGSGVLLKKAFEKYGIENFRKNVLFICENEEYAYAKEWIEILKVRALKSWDDYYNISYGGKGSMTGRKHSEETKEKLAISLKNRYVSEKTRKKISDIHRGKILSEETKLKIKNNHARPFLGKTLNEETKLKLSKSKTGVKNPMFGVRAPNSKEVILINTCIKFRTLKEAREYIGLKNSSNIMLCCRGERKSAGKINGEPARWMYYEDYLEISQQSYK
ncbi:hypothetical protein GCM10008904_14370 [Paraclostridium ghonii]|uniref:Group I intron endonuclease n=1 Tax=Paraclostridium ghonii TaxID=29358 RepID=A0ABU0N145_9FIRM|nr:NUMOD3 domain-containing DNA-binding protein [Paeniclostridium ghonii]MDQ0556446.1 group I intron endonuclease [Paeniclostridium ghonii]